MTKKIIIALTASLFALSTAACNTVSGAGEDLQSVSKDTEEAIND